MQPRPRLVLLVLQLFCVVTPAAQANRFTLFERVWGDCVVVTDMTEAGRALTPPSRERPVYFLGESLGGRLGSMAGDRLPDEKEMRRFVAKVLAKQGYLAAQPGVHEPELFMVLQWGRLDARSGELLWFLGYDPRHDLAAQMLDRPGIEVHFRAGRSREVETVLEYASGDIYGIVITAFKYQSDLAEEPVVLWQTRIGLPANGKAMPEALTVMAEVAGPQIGRETLKPVLRGTEDRRYSTELGELKVIGFEEIPSEGDAGQ